MKVIGLTGGIASGKSLVAGMLRQLGAHVIDADLIAREVVADAEVRRAIAAAFGPAVLGADGMVDRKVLGDRIFADSGARARLNAITHPRIRQRIADEITRLRATHSDGTVVLDIPLLLDVAPVNAYDLDGIVVVLVDEPTQEARLRARDQIGAEEARQRLRAQRPLREKVAEATWVIDNSGTPAETRRQVEALWTTWQRA
ncbi:MAG TPA: dephospho-CoA kinase [bacterium]|nr:dephospho-CoA kinase [bacterium]